MHDHQMQRFLNEKKNMGDATHPSAVNIQSSAPMSSRSSSYSSPECMSQNAPWLSVSNPNPTSFGMGQRLPSPKMFKVGAKNLSVADEMQVKLPHIADRQTNRRSRHFVPMNRKDECYWAKRRKNNEAARKSREKRRVNDIMLEQRVLQLLEENLQLKKDLLTVKMKYNEIGPAEVEEIKKCMEEQESLHHRRINFDKEDGGFDDNLFKVKEENNLPVFSFSMSENDAKLSTCSARSDVHSLLNPSEAAMENCRGRRVISCTTQDTISAMIIKGEISGTPETLPFPTANEERYRDRPSTSPLDFTASSMCQRDVRQFDRGQEVMSNSGIDCTSNRAVSNPWKERPGQCGTSDYCQIQVPRQNDFAGLLQMIKQREAIDQPSSQRFTSEDKATGSRLECGEKSEPDQGQSPVPWDTADDSTQKAAMALASLCQHLSGMKRKSSSEVSETEYGQRKSPSPSSFTNRSSENVPGLENSPHSYEKLSDYPGQREPYKLHRIQSNEDSQYTSPNRGPSTPPSNGSYPMCLPNPVQDTSPCSETSFDQHEVPSNKSSTDNQVFGVDSSGFESSSSLSPFSNSISDESLETNQAEEKTHRLPYKLRFKLASSTSTV